MDRSLNLPLLEQTIHGKGFTQTSLAAKLGVTKAAVSKWLVGKSFPRPPELLKLGKALGLGYNQLIRTSVVEHEPLVAFRKRASTKTTLVHFERAKEMARLLEPLVKHLPFDQFLSPGRLKDPRLDYVYIQEFVAKLRKDLKLDPTGEIKFTDLIDKFQELQAVLVPVLWGQKQRHENALHIYLPETRTTWIYLNLDSQLHDFKFWMAHELGHVLAVDLLKPETMDQAEDFSDAFAGALLFPEIVAAPLYEAYQSAHGVAERMTLIHEAAREHVISPNSVYLQVRAYAQHKGKPFESLAEKTFFALLTSFNKNFPSVSESLFGSKKPSADHFMRIVSQVFKTPVFTALAGYLKEGPHSVGLLSRMLDVPLTDAKELRQALI